MWISGAKWCMIISENLMPESTCCPRRQDDHPHVGLEPITFGLEVQRLVYFARGAFSFPVSVR